MVGGVGSEDVLRRRGVRLTPSDGHHGESEREHAERDCERSEIVPMVTRYRFHVRRIQAASDTGDGR